MPSDCRHLRVFLKAFIELCSRRRAGLDPALKQALCSIIAEMDREKLPSFENLLEFEKIFSRIVSPDPHLKYLHCVLKGFRERKYRFFSPDPVRPALAKAAS